MARASDGTDVPVSPLPASSSNVGYPNGSLLDLEGTAGYRASTMEETINEMFAQIAKLPLLLQSVSRFENCVQTLSHTVASYDAKITNIQQMVSSLAALVTTLEMNATSVSSGSGSARLWNILGHGDGATATGSLGSHGPWSSDDNGHTRRRLDTFSSPEDEQARSAVLLRFPCEQYHKGITEWINNLWKNPICQHTTNLSEFIAKQVLCRSGLYLKHEPSVTTLLLDIKMMVSPMQLTVPSAVPIHLSLSANPNQLMTERLANNLRPDQLKLLFPDR